MGYSATIIIRPTLFSDTIISEWYNRQILAHFLFENVSDKRNGLWVLSASGATAHTLWSSVSALQNVFRDQIICHPLWPAHSPSCDQYLWQV